MQLDQTDRAILDILQNAMPLALQPFQDIANQLAISEDEVIRRIAGMKEAGLIRRIGGIMDSRQLGFYSTLCAVSVPGDRIEEVAALINLRAGVTHNYLRDHQYNIWFTLTAPSKAESDKQLRDLEHSFGLKILSMPTTKVYKIKVSFDMGDQI